MNLFLQWLTGVEVLLPVELSGILASYLVSVGFEGTGIDDPSVVHQLVTLVVWKSVEVVGFGVFGDPVSFDNLGLARLLLRVLDFVKNVLTHDVIV